MGRASWREFGKVFSVSKFQGLESLTLKSSKRLENTLDFFGVVGSSLKHLKINFPVGSIGRVSVPLQIWDSLSNLEELDAFSVDIDDLAVLPSTISKLRLPRTGDTTTFNTLINLKDLTIGYLNVRMNLSTLPPLDLMSIRNCLESDVNLRFLSNFQNGNLKRLVLGEYFDCKEVVTKCEELGIILEKWEE